MALHHLFHSLGIGHASAGMASGEDDYPPPPSLLSMTGAQMRFARLARFGNWYFDPVAGKIIQTDLSVGSIVHIRSGVPGAIVNAGTGPTTAQSSGSSTTDLTPQYTSSGAPIHQQSGSTSAQQDGGGGYDPASDPTSGARPPIHAGNGSSSSSKKTLIAGGLAAAALAVVLAKAHS